MSDRQLKPATKRLLEGRARISNPQNWTQNHLSRLIASDDGVYQTYCALGAIGFEEEAPVQTVLIEEVMAYLYRGVELPIYTDHASDIAHYNDSPDRTHKEILELFDNAIQLSLNV